MPDLAADPSMTSRSTRWIGAAVVAIAACGSATVTARADEGPTLHRVTYTVTADRPVAVDVYYRAVDPPSWSEYSHDPYRFSPRDEAELVPGGSWVREATLIDPMRWAMVSVTTPDQPSDSQRSIRCELAVDGVVVNRGVGMRGALCSLRNW
jgi:hypothetical protein